MASISTVAAMLEKLSDRELKLAATVIRQILQDRKALQDEATQPIQQDLAGSPPPS